MAVANHMNTGVTDAIGTSHTYGMPTYDIISELSASTEMLFNIIKALILSMSEEQVLTAISHNPEIYMLIDNPTEEMTEMYEMRKL